MKLLLAFLMAVCACGDDGETPVCTGSNHESCFPPAGVRSGEEAGGSAGASNARSTP